MAKPGARSKPVIGDLARAVGVSVTTVSHAFNRPERVAPATRERVMRAAAEMGYTGPDPTARQLRLGHAGAVGVVYSDELGFAFDDPATASILGGLSRACAARDLNLLLVPLGQSAGPRSQALANAAVDGFVIYSVSEHAPGLDLVLARSLPTVIIDSPQDVKEAAFVGLDDRGATRLLVEHLTQLGHRRVGIISSRLGTSRYNGPASPERWREAPYVIIANRILGVHDALGAEPGAVPIEERFDNTVESGARALHDLLDRHPELTAVCCLTDVLALGALTAATQRGLDVPRDLTVTGWDDLPEARRVGLTTIGQPLAEKGQTAGEILLGGGPDDGSRRVILPTSVEIRRTSAAPRRDG